MANCGDLPIERSVDCGRGITDDIRSPGESADQPIDADSPDSGAMGSDVSSSAGGARSVLVLEFDRWAQQRRRRTGADAPAAASVHCHQVGAVEEMISASGYAGGHTAGDNPLGAVGPRRSRGRRRCGRC